VAAVALICAAAGARPRGLRQPPVPRARGQGPGVRHAAADWWTRCCTSSSSTALPTAQVPTTPHVDRMNQAASHGGDLAGSRRSSTRSRTSAPRRSGSRPWRSRSTTAAGPGAPGVPVPAAGSSTVLHGYWADDYQSLDPRFGHRGGAQGAGDAAHARGMKVLLDVVYNHVGYDSRYLKIRQGRLVPHEARRLRRRCAHLQVAACPISAPSCRGAGLPARRAAGLAKRTGSTVPSRHRQARRARVLAAAPPGDARAARPGLLPARRGLGRLGNGARRVLRQRRDGRGASTSPSRAAARPTCRARAHHRLRLYSRSATGSATATTFGTTLVARRADVAVTPRRRQGRLPPLRGAQDDLPRDSTIYYGEEVARDGSVWPLNRNDMPWGSRSVLPGKGLKRDESLRGYYRTLIATRRANPAVPRHIPHALLRRRPAGVRALRRP